MASGKTETLIPPDIITSKIYFIRGSKVMLDRDLAELYGVPNKRLNQQVKRNITRFPEDFMFMLKFKEFSDLKSQFATSSWGGIRKLPYVFTENGIAMLSSVLNSERAIHINIEIMRIFTKIRAFYAEQKTVFNQLNRHEIKLLQHDKQIAEVFKAFSDISQKTDSPKKRKIGFLPPEEK